LEALGSQVVPAQYIKILHELYKISTTKISPFYHDINVDVKRGIRQGHTISQKLFTTTFQNVMRKLEWDNMGVKIDGGQINHLRFADDIVLITSDISQAEHMLADFDKACGKIGLQLNLKKTMLMKNGLVSFAPLTLNGTNISEYSSYVYLSPLSPVVPLIVDRRKRAAWGAFKSIEDAVKRTKNIRLRAHLFDSTVLPALTHASNTCSLRKQDERSLSVIERSVERTMLGVPRFTQVRDGIRSSDLRQRPKINDAVLYAKQSKIRWAGHVMRMNDNRWTGAVCGWIPRDVKRTAGRPPTRWSEFITKSLEERYDARQVPKARRTHWATLARNREKWRIYWHPLGSLDDQRDYR
uniref:Reverse transcriptase domain-containing protein n=1 Tax=Angiostrongylus cantonensis TaxID=6313 RepID=A0A0K0DRJ6_ANGCA